MTADPWGLLREVREYIVFIGAVNDPNKPDFLNRIDSALAARPISNRVAVFCPRHQGAHATFTSNTTALVPIPYCPGCETEAVAKQDKITA